MYEKICRRHRLSGNVKGFNGERLYGAMNMWADTLPNNSFTSCKLLIDVQEHRYHPYRFRSTNRIQKTVSYTVSKARSEKKSVHQKSLWNNKNSLWKPETDRADRKQDKPSDTPGNGLRPAGRRNKTKWGFPGRYARREPPREIRKGPSGNPPGGLDQKVQRKNAAACYSPTPSRVQYHRRARP